MEILSKIVDLIFFKTFSSSKSGSGKTSINFINRGTLDKSTIISCNDSDNLFEEILEKTFSMIGSNFNRLHAAVERFAGRTDFSLSKSLQTIPFSSGLGFVNTRSDNAIPIL